MRKLSIAAALALSVSFAMASSDVTMEKNAPESNSTYMVDANQTDQNTPTQSVQNFIQRLYQNILGRTADQGGLSYWQNQLKNKTAADVAMSFFHSQEFTNKQLDDSAFIQTVYQTILGREADNGGLRYWQSQIKGGKSKDAILEGFLHSTEFSNLAKAYGVMAYE